MRKTQIKSELSQGVYGIKYSRLDEGQKEFIKDEYEGMISIMHEMFPNLKKK
tara:strand:- start:64 stop:219 length:156 start_codon:yes stop_codon:yes gene_type:complete